MAHKTMLDTHALVWYLEANPRLAANAKAAIDDPNAELVLPIIALAEAAFVVERHRSSIPRVEDLLSRVQADPRIEIYPLTLAIVIRSQTVQSIPELHDRLIVATVLHLQDLGHTASLLTKDSTIADSRLVPVVW